MTAAPADIAGARVAALRRRFANALQRLADAERRGEPIGAAQLDFDEARAALELAERPETTVPTYQLLCESITECLRPIGFRLTTGFPTLDDATRGGLPVGRVVGSSGAPASGKSTFATQFADRCERMGCAVVYGAWDEPADGIIIRLGQLEGFSREALESEGQAGEAVRRGFAHKAHGRPIVVLDPDAGDSACTIEFAAKVLEHIAGGRPKVLIIDSLQTAPCAAAEGLESARDRIDAKIACLKVIAKTGVLVFFISEMARSGYRTGDRNVDISALAAGKESGSIEYACSLLLGLRSVKGEPGLVDVEIAKNRLGSQKSDFRVKLDFERASFSEVSKPQAEEQGEARADTRMEAAKDRVRKAVRSNHDLQSQRDVLAKCDGGRSANHDAIREMERRGELVRQEGVYRLKGDL